MYTEVNNYLGEIIVDAQRCDLPHTIKSKLLVGLRFLHGQALCDEDRRLPVNQRRAHWGELLLLLKGTNFLDRYRPNKRMWHAIEVFMGVSAATPPAAENPKIGENAKTTKWSRAEAAEFFEFLARAAESKSALSELEILALRFGLYYLEAEAKRTRYQRDKNRIRFTWRYVQPLLRKGNMLQPFHKEHDLVRRVKNFVSDSILS